MMDLMSLDPRLVRQFARQDGMADEVEVVGGAGEGTL
jgi:hypothetical protein